MSAARLLAALYPGWGCPSNKNTITLSVIVMIPQHLITSCTFSYVAFLAILPAFEVSSSFCKQDVLVCLSMGSPHYFSR